MNEIHVKDHTIHCYYILQGRLLVKVKIIPPTMPLITKYNYILILALPSFFLTFRILIIIFKGSLIKGTGLVIDSEFRKKSVVYVTYGELQDVCLVKNNLGIWIEKKLIEYIYEHPAMLHYITDSELEKKEVMHFFFYFFINRKTHERP